MAEQKELSRREKRMQRKAGREQRRDDRASQMVSAQAGRYGIDLKDATSAPLTEGSKERITTGIKKGIPKEIAEDVQGFSEAYAGPQFEKAPILDEQKLKESAKRQRGYRFWDALSGFGQGIRYGKVDPTSLGSYRERAEREQQFQDYRDITERNKKTQELWEHQYRTDLLAFLREQAQDERLGKQAQQQAAKAAQDLEIQMQQHQAEYGTEGKPGFKERQMQTQEKQAEAARLRAENYGKIKEAKTEEYLENDAEYQLRKKQVLLDERKQKGKEAADKLENSIKGFEKEISNLENEKYKLEAQKEEYGWGNKTEKADIDKKIAEIDKKIDTANQNIEKALKGATSKIDEFFD